MLRALNTVLVLTLFGALLVGIALTVRMGMNSVDHALATALPKHRAAAKPAPAEAALGFGHGISTRH